MKAYGGILPLALILGLLIFSSIWVFKLSQNSLPGDTLYNLKQFTEEFRVTTTELVHGGRALAHIKSANERLNEIEILEKKKIDPRQLVPLVERAWVSEKAAINEYRRGKERGDNVNSVIVELVKIQQRQEIILKRLLKITPEPGFYTILNILDQAKREIGSATTQR